MEKNKDWLIGLLENVKKKGIVTLFFDEELTHKAECSRNSFSEFTKTYQHDHLPGMSYPQVCIIMPENGYSGEDAFYIGIISSKRPDSTFDTRIKFKKGKKIYINIQEFQAFFENDKLTKENPVFSISYKNSEKLINRLAENSENYYSLRSLSELLETIKNFSSNEAFQEDAIQMALKAFGIGSGDKAFDVSIIDNQTTGLARLKSIDDKKFYLSEDNNTREKIPFIEDNAIAKDNRSFPGYSLKLDSLTGKALFEKEGRLLEIYTANRTSLEHSLGVDLIYINLHHNNVVLVQYKILRPNKNTKKQDWVYYPDEQLDIELSKMKVFNCSLSDNKNEYRLNSNLCYLKFVKQDANLRNGSIILPIDHYEKILNSSITKGRNKSVRISYESLKGQYLRQGPFLGLIQSGYIGSFAKTTTSLKIIINEIIKGNKAVITAIQRKSTEN